MCSSETVAKPPFLSPLESALPDACWCKSFRMRSYEKPVGGGGWRGISAIHESGSITPQYISRLPSLPPRAGPGAAACAANGIVCYNPDGFSSAYRRIMAKTTTAKRALSKPAKKGEPVYNRIVLKLSGESFQGPQGFGIDGETIQA